MKADRGGGQEKGWKEGGMVYTWLGEGREGEEEEKGVRRREGRRGERSVARSENRGSSGCEEEEGAEILGKDGGGRGEPRGPSLAPSSPPRRAQKIVL